MNDENDETLPPPPPSSPPPPPESPPKPDVEPPAPTEECRMDDQVEPDQDVPESVTEPVPDNAAPDQEESGGVLIEDLDPNNEENDMEHEMEQETHVPFPGGEGTIFFFSQ